MKIKAMMIVTKKSTPKKNVKKPSSLFEILYKPSATSVTEKSNGRINPMYKNSGDFKSIFYLYHDITS